MLLLQRLIVYSGGSFFGRDCWTGRTVSLSALLLPLLLLLRLRLRLLRPAVVAAAVRHEVEQRLQFV